MQTPKLENFLDSIDWSSFSHAYGTAEDVPDHLRSLMRDNGGDCSEAVELLHSSICHQGTIYSATAPTVPFLLELIRSPATTCRVEILDLLADISKGSLPLEADKRDRDQRALEESWAQDTIAAVWKGIDALLPQLSDVDRRVRLSAIYAIGQLLRTEDEHSQERDIVTNALRRQMAQESDELVKASVVFALAVTTDRHLSGELLKQLESASSAQVKLAAALCLVDSGHGSAPEVIEALATALSTPNIEDIFSTDQPSDPERRWRFRWGENVKGKLIAELCKLASPFTPQVAESLFSALRQESPFTVEIVLLPILSTLFAETKLGPNTTPAELTSQQIEALEILLANESLWDFSYGDCPSLFESLGLPNSRWKWERLLDKPGWRAETQEQLFINLQRFVEHSTKTQHSSPSGVKNTTMVEYLDLEGIVDGDKYLPHLSLYPELQVLRLGDGEVTDEGLWQMPILQSLREVYLFDNAITDDGVRALSRLETLEVVNLTNTEIGDEGLLSLLQGLPHLRALTVSHTSITDRIVTALIQAKSLANLDVTGTAISDDGLTILHRELTRCRVYPANR